MVVLVAAAHAVALALSFSPAPSAESSAPRSIQSDTLRLAEALRLAREANPMLRAARARAGAARERVAPAGAWTNPELGVGVVNRPISTFGTEEEMTMNTVRLAQVVPWPGKRRAGRTGASERAASDSLQALESETMLAARVAMTYFELAAIDRSLAVMRQTLALLGGFEEISSAQYAVGEAIQQDVLQAQVSVARMAADIMVMEQERVAGAARLNALLAREPDVPVGALELPAIGPAPPPVDSLAGLAAQRRPALAAAAARIRAATAQVDLARRELWPDLMLAVEYGQRPRYNDMVSLMVGFSVPVFAGSRQLPMRREFEAMRAMEEAEAVQLRNETWARLAELRAMAGRARALAELYRTRVLPQAQAAVDAALSAYRVGRADYMTLVESQMTVNRYAIEQLRLAAEYHSAMAEIQALLGGAEGTL